MCLDSELLVNLKDLLASPNVTVLIFLLKNGSARYSQLTRLTRSRSTLSSALNELEKEEMIKRTAVSTKPVSVNYSLTDKGKEIASNFVAIKERLVS